LHAVWRQPEPEVGLIAGHWQAAVRYLCARRQAHLLQWDTGGSASKILAYWRICHSHAKVLPIRSVHTGVRNAGQTGPLRDMGDLQATGQTTRPGQVGLENIKAAASRGICNRRQRVPAFAASQQLQNVAIGGGTYAAISAMTCTEITPGPLGI